jgi:PHD/YefM family antitoxin component YafN of YafNO toxin-antitoxin module
VQNQGEAVVIEKQGQPTAVLISVALYEQIVRRRETAYRVVSDVQRQNQTVELSEEELLGWVDEAIHEVRARPSGAA